MPEIRNLLAIPCHHVFVRTGYQLVVADVATATRVRVAVRHAVAAAVAIIGAVHGMGCTADSRSQHQDVNTQRTHRSHGSIPCDKVSFYFTQNWCTILPVLRRFGFHKHAGVPAKWGMTVCGMRFPYARIGVFFGSIQKIVKILLSSPVYFAYFTAFQNHIT